MNARFLAWWQETGGGDSWQLRIAEQAWEAAFNVGYEEAACYMRGCNIDIQENERLFTEQQMIDCAKEAAAVEREACAKACERIAEQRFFDHGITDSDAGIGYYNGLYAEEYDTRDEEDEQCAAAIRARSKEQTS